VKWLSLPFDFKGKRYFMCPLTGDLLEEPASPSPTSQLPHKLIHALALCDFPYSLSQPPPGEGPLDPNEADLPRRVSLRLIKLCAANFFLARIYSGVPRPVFENAAQAVVFFRSIMAGQQQKNLCLPRALFAAKTSRAFAASGVVFLGTFLPSRLMHAWVIESGCQPDSRDDIWTQYRPVAALV
jgi:hypothetical protein